MSVQSKSRRLPRYLPTASAILDRPWGPTKLMKPRHNNTALIARRTAKGTVTINDTFTFRGYEHENEDEDEGEDEDEDEDEVRFTRRDIKSREELTCSA